MSRWAALLVLILIGACRSADAQITNISDYIHGDANVTMEWSPGTWTLNNTPVPECATFASGATTSPGESEAADSVLCSPAPNGWHWTVTVPGPFTINYDFNYFPPGFLICGQIFYSLDHPLISIGINPTRDRIEVRSGDGSALLYAGAYSEFDPVKEGFLIVAASRCGRYLPLPVGACCLPTGECLVLIPSDCQAQGGVHLGGGVSCTPNPCPVPPVPNEKSSWGSIKRIYR